MNLFADPPLTAFVKALRSHQHEELSFVQKQLELLRSECEDRDPEKKAWALLKLTHLNQHLLAGDLSFTAFPIVETATRSVLWQKQVGLLAASLLFHSQTPETLLLANQLRKDLHSGNRNEQALALTGFAGFASADLAEALWPDVAALFTSARPYLRKRAVVAFHRSVRQCPEVLPACWPRFVNLLQDADPSVVCASVTVALEEVHTYPELFIQVIPRFYEIASQGGSNWLLIKVLMVLDALCAHEPRLPKKLASLVTSMIEATQAKSLVFECCRVACRRLADDGHLLCVAIARLIAFVEGTNQNLRYLALKVLRNVVEYRPSIISQKQLQGVLNELQNNDILVRLAALELLSSRVHTADDLRCLAQSMERMSLLEPALGRAPNRDTSEELRFRSMLFSELWRCIRRVFPDGSTDLAEADAAWLLVSIVRPALVRASQLDEKNVERFAVLLWKLVQLHESLRGSAAAVCRQVLDRCLSESHDWIRYYGAIRVCVWILGTSLEGMNDSSRAANDLERLTGLFQLFECVRTGDEELDSFAALQTTVLRTLRFCCEHLQADFSLQFRERLQRIVLLSPSAFEEHWRLLGIQRDVQRRAGEITRRSAPHPGALQALLRSLPALSSHELSECWADPHDLPPPTPTPAIRRPRKHSESQGASRSGNNAEAALLLLDTVDANDVVRAPLTALPYRSAAPASATNESRGERDASSAHPLQASASAGFTTASDVWAAHRFASAPDDTSTDATGMEAAGASARSTTELEHLAFYLRDAPSAHAHARHAHAPAASVPSNQQAADALSIGASLQGNACTRHDAMRAPCIAGTSDAPDDALLIDFCAPYAAIDGGDAPAGDDAPSTTGADNLGPGRCVATPEHTQAAV
jgi:hypothetical protein